jgi:pyrimidine operon attenuation protein / uracil phosphoribosyltransferase
MPDIPKTSEEIQTLLQDLSEGLVRSITRWDKVVFIGIRSGGELIARNLVRRLKNTIDIEVPLGVLDIALYRDDFTKRKLNPEVGSTDIPFAVDEKDVVLVDDVLYTGRSVRAAIDHIVDLGRPHRIYLLVLFDREGRELPIQADFVGRKINLPEEKIVKLESSPDGQSIDGVVVSEVKR